MTNADVNLALSILIVIFGGGWIIRSIARCLFFKKKMDIKWWFGIFPVYSEALVYRKIKEHKLYWIGAACRLLGIAGFVGAMLFAQYITNINSVHIFGIVLGTTEEVPFAPWFQIMTVAGGMALVVGIVIRSYLARELLKYFGGSTGVLHFCGMLLPGLFELMLTFSRSRTFLLNKKPKDMDRTEYLLYRNLTEE